MPSPAGESPRASTPSATTRRLGRWRRRRRRCPRGERSTRCATNCTADGCPTHPLPAGLCRTGCAGNALTSPELDSRGAVEFWWAHAIISTESLTEITRNCDFASIQPLLAVGVGRWAGAVCCLAVLPSRTLPTMHRARRVLQEGVGVGVGNGSDGGGSEYVSAAEGEQRLRSRRPAAAVGSREEKCDRFVQRAMEEMGGINICERRRSR